MPGIDLELLDSILARLRNERFQFLDLQTALTALEEAETLSRPTVVFTVDDGYADFRWGAEIFRRYNCPVTVFLATGFVDGECWLWWDEVEYCCLEAAAGTYAIGDREVRVELSDDRAQSRIQAAMELWRHCKALADADKRCFIDEIADALRVKVPQAPPPGYAPLSWDEIRALESTGTRFAPHTVTHPILSKTGDDQARREIEESWRRVQQELSRPTPVLAYPNGQPGDFGERECRIARSAGLRAAVTMQPDYATADLFERPDGAFAVPRLPEPMSVVAAALTARGFERISRLRHRR